MYEYAVKGEDNGVETERGNEEDARRRKMEDAEGESKM